MTENPFNRLWPMRFEYHARQFASNASQSKQTRWSSLLPFFSLRHERKTGIVFSPSLESEVWSATQAVATDFSAWEGKPSFVFAASIYFWSEPNEQAKTFCQPFCYQQKTVAVMLPFWRVTYLRDHIDSADNFTAYSHEISLIRWR